MAHDKGIRFRKQFHGKFTLVHVSKISESTHFGSLGQYKTSTRLRSCLSKTLNIEELFISTLRHLTTFFKLYETLIVVLVSH